MFSKKGFYNTKISDIAESMDMSVGSFYKYFPSKQNLARASITFVTKKLASNLRNINNQDVSQKDKIHKFVESYLNFTQNHPEMIDYFFRVYLSNREVFCENNDSGFSLAKEFVDEIERLVNDGIKVGEFKNQNFHVAFSSIVGILGAMTFLNGEGVLEKDIKQYTTEITKVIFNSLQ